MSASVFFDRMDPVKRFGSDIECLTVEVMQKILRLESPSEWRAKTFDPKTSGGFIIIFSSNVHVPVSPESVEHIIIACRNSVSKF